MGFVLFGLFYYVSYWWQCPLLWTMSLTSRYLYKNFWFVLLWGLFYLVCSIMSPTGDNVP